jgi:hypothetical protein
MLILDKKLWQTDKILKITSSNNWSEPDTEVLLMCALNTVKELVESCTEKKCVLLLSCDSGEVPSFYYLGKIFMYLLSIKSVLEKGLDFTILYGSQESIGNVFPTILKLYKPVRPIHIINTKNELKNILKNR